VAVHFRGLAHESCISLALKPSQSWAKGRSLAPDGVGVLLELLSHDLLNRIVISGSLILKHTYIVMTVLSRLAGPVIAVPAAHCRT
jgi:hypothetical protein